MAEIELAAAVGTVEESVQRAFVPYVLLPASAAFSHLMNGLPGIFIHDGGLRVLRDDPVRFIVERGLVGFVGDGFAPLADRVAAVLLPIKDIQDCSGVP